jgi:hypothetical protein
MATADSAVLLRPRGTSGRNSMPPKIENHFKLCAQSPATLSPFRVKNPLAQPLNKGFCIKKSNSKLNKY